MSTAPNEASSERLRDSLARCVRQVERLSPAPVQGSLTRMVGLALEAVGCQAAIGDSCDVMTNDGSSIEAEVVGFSVERLGPLNCDETVRRSGVRSRRN